jgi:hypothetical protein
MKSPMSTVDDYKLISSPDVSRILPYSLSQPLVIAHRPHSAVHGSDNCRTQYIFSPMKSVFDLTDMQKRDQSLV